MKSGPAVYHAGPLFRLFHDSDCPDSSVHKRSSASAGAWRNEDGIVVPYCVVSKMLTGGCPCIPPIRKGWDTPAVWCVPPQLVKKILPGFLDKLRKISKLISQVPKFCDTNVKENPNSYQPFLMAAWTAAIKNLAISLNPSIVPNCILWLIFYLGFLPNSLLFNNFLTLPRCVVIFPILL